MMKLPTRRRALVARAVAALLVAAAATQLPAFVKSVDRRWFGESLKDLFASRWYYEDWTTAAPLSEPDYAWLPRTGVPLRIAHALGAAGGADANRIASARSSLAAGLRFLEVDLWLDPRTGIVHCHHGPEAPPPEPACRIEELAALLATVDDAWLVLDLKTAFEPTLFAVLEPLQARGLAQRAIVQLYQPEDFAVYAAARRRFGPLPGPIVATHLAHRSVDHVAGAAEGLGARALSIPLDRLPALHEHARIATLAHPVHDCAAWRAALQRSVAGVYTTYDLRCETSPARVSALAPVPGTGLTHVRSIP